MSQIATAVFAFMILGLLMLDRQRNAATSKALWLPVVWFWIAGSRAVSIWLEVGPASSVDQYIEGSPLDRNIYMAMMAIGLAILVMRGKRIQELLRNNVAVVAFVSYCAVSTIWSDYPDVAFRRWIKFLGDFVMILIMLTDRQPVVALRQVMARVGFVLLPISILLIKYYPTLGRYWGRWEGTAFYGGVTTDKNMLGKTCLIFGLAASWRLLQEMSSSRRGRIIAAQGCLVAMTLWLLRTCNSMTSLSCFVMASGLMAALSFLSVARNRAIIHSLVLSIVLVCASMLFLGLGGDVLNSMGRDSTLTGRTELWSELVRMSVNPILGTGFESFWLGDRLERLWRIHWWHPNESHNGYLEMFLNLGFVGLILFAAVIITGYRNIISLLHKDAEAGRIRLAYFVVGITYNFTEAATRTMDVVWVSFMLAAIAVPRTVVARKVTVRLTDESLELRRASADAGAYAGDERFSAIGL